MSIVYTNTLESGDKNIFFFKGLRRFIVMPRNRTFSLSSTFRAKSTFLSEVFSCINVKNRWTYPKRHAFSNRKSQVWPRPKTWRPYGGYWAVLALINSAMYDICKEAVCFEVKTSIVSDYLPKCIYISTTFINTQVNNFSILYQNGHLLLLKLVLCLTFLGKLKKNKNKNKKKLISNIVLKTYFLDQ